VNRLSTLALRAAFLLPEPVHRIVHFSPPFRPSSLPPVPTPFTGLRYGLLPDVGIVWATGIMELLKLVVAQESLTIYATRFIYNTDNLINNGNRTEWSPVRSVIIRVISKIGRPRIESPILSITSTITDRIGRH